MNRLERKCFVTAAAAHGLLFVILIVGPAFLMHSAKNDSFREITVYSPSSIDRALTQDRKSVV